MTPWENEPSTFRLSSANCATAYPVEAGTLRFGVWLCCWSRRLRWLVDSVPLPGNKSVAFGTALTESAIWLSRRRRNFNDNMAQYSSYSYCDIRSLMIGAPFAVRTQILLYASLFFPKPENLLPWLPECNSRKGKSSSVQHEVKRGTVGVRPLIFNSANMEMGV